MLLLALFFSAFGIILFATIPLQGRGLDSRLAPHHHGTHLNQGSNGRGHHLPCCEEIGIPSSFMSNFVHVSFLANSVSPNYSRSCQSMTWTTDPCCLLFDISPPSSSLSALYTSHYDIQYCTNPWRRFSLHFCCNSSDVQTKRCN